MSERTGQHSALDARDDLLWIADRWTLLRARLRPGGGNGLNGMPRGAASGVPIDTHVSDLMFEITEKVARFYGRILLDEVPTAHGCHGACHGSLEHRCDCPAGALPITPERCPQRVDPITTSAMPALLEQVARRHGHFTADPMMALGFSDDASEYRDKVRHTLERPAPPTYVGPCQHKGDDGAGCEGELYVREHHGGGACRVCGTAFTLAEQVEWLDRELAQRLMTASEIVSALMVLGLPTPIGTVKSWIRRERLVEVSDDTGLYRLADAKALADRRPLAVSA